MRILDLKDKVFMPLGIVVFLDCSRLVLDVADLEYSIWIHGANRVFFGKVLSLGPDICDIIQTL